MMIYASKLQAFNNKPLCLTLDVVVVVVVLWAVYY